MTMLMKATTFLAAMAVAALFAQPALAATVPARAILAELGKTAGLVDVVKQRGGSGHHHGEGRHGHHGGRMGRGRGDSGEWYGRPWPAYGYACPRYQWTASGWHCIGPYRGYGPPAVVIFGYECGGW